MQSFGARLRSARNARKLTQARLGERLGVSNTAISRWESDIDQPQFALLQSLRAILDISLDELVCGIAPSKGVADAAAYYGELDDMQRSLLRYLQNEPQEKTAALLLVLGIDGNGR